MPAQSGPAGPRDGPASPSPDTPSTRDPVASADELKRAAHDAGEAVKSAGADLKRTLVDKGTGKVDRATDTAGASLHQVADQLKQAADGLGGQQAWAGDALKRGADGIEKVSSYLANGRFDDFARDLKSFARSDPALFLAGSVALGFAAARVARVAAHRATDDTDQAAQAYTDGAGSMSEPRSFAPTVDGSGLTGSTATSPTGGLGGPGESD